MLEINRKKRYADQGNAKAKKISEQRASSSKECFTKATLTSNSSQPDKSTNTDKSINTNKSIRQTTQNK